MESNHGNQSKKILMKQKFPKESSGEDHHQEEAEKTRYRNQEPSTEAAAAAAEAVHFRSVCNKSFSSKKALGGHMSSHVQFNKGFNHMKKLKPNQTSKLKKPSNKAEATLNHGVEGEDDDQFYSAAAAAPMVNPEVDLTQNLESGSGNARRSSNTKLIISVDHRQELLEVSGQLLSLGKDIIPGTKSCSSDKRDYVYAVQVVSNTDSQLTLQSLEASSGAIISKDESRSDQGKRKSLVDTEAWKNMESSKEYIHGDFSDHDGADSNEAIGDDAKAKSKKRREKMEKRIDAKAAAKATPGKHTCTVCGNHFTSYQALGGHKSSHNKFKIKIENAIDDCNDPQASKESTDEQTAEGTIISPNHHECRICKNTFATGQALGGHMRSHLTTSIETAASSNQESTSREGSTEERQKIMEFDLNEPPADMED